MVASDSTRTLNEAALIQGLCVATYIFQDMCQGCYYYYCYFIYLFILFSYFDKVCAQ